jgi:hypothetical protein
MSRTEIGYTGSSGRTARPTTLAVLEEGAVIGGEIVHEGDGAQDGRGNPERMDVLFDPALLS